MGVLYVTKYELVNNGKSVMLTEAYEIDLFFDEVTLYTSLYTDRNKETYWVCNKLKTNRFRTLKMAQRMQSYFKRIQRIYLGKCDDLLVKRGILKSLREKI